MAVVRGQRVRSCVWVGLRKESNASAKKWPAVFISSEFDMSGVAQERWSTGFAEFEMRRRAADDGWTAWRRMCRGGVPAMSPANSARRRHWSLR